MLNLILRSPDINEKAKTTFVPIAVPPGANFNKKMSVADIVFPILGLWGVAPLSWLRDYPSPSSLPSPLVPPIVARLLVRVRTKEDTIIAIAKNGFRDNLGRENALPILSSYWNNG